MVTSIFGSNIMDLTPMIVCLNCQAGVKASGDATAFADALMEAALAVREWFHGKKIMTLRRGLCRIEAAGYVGVSPSLFDEMVKDRRMPKSIRINSRTVWDMYELDEAFEALKEEPQRNPWDDAA